MPKLKRSKRTAEVPEWSRRELLARCSKEDDVDAIIQLSKHEDEEVRVAALREMCPCRVKSDLAPFWERVLGMTGDASEAVRRQVLHTLCDGSPAHLEEEVVEALRGFVGDKDHHTRRQANKVLAHYGSTGKWNIL